MRTSTSAGSCASGPGGGEDDEGEGGGEGEGGMAAQLVSTGTGAGRTWCSAGGQQRHAAPRHAPKTRARMEAGLHRPAAAAAAT